jgi:methylmalonyl-CoA mutase cobalamin-binding domain/chain
MEERVANQALVVAVADLDEVSALRLVSDRLGAGASPWTIIDECSAGMRIVGERYERREYFLSALIMAGEIFRQVMEMVKPSVEQLLAGQVSGRVLLGTVRGDIHDLGKDMVHLALSSFGFTVEDLGVDVPPSRFVERAVETRPDIIGLSGVLTSSFSSMRETVALLRQQASALEGIPIVIGGGMVNEDICRFVGADHWANDGVEGVRLCRRLVHGEVAPQLP